MTPKIQHTIGPRALDIDHAIISQHIFRPAGFGMGDDGEPTVEDRGDANLLLIADQAPHQCDVPDCPGPKNLAKLQAAEQLAAALEAALGAMTWSTSVTQATEALTAWKEATQ